MYAELHLHTNFSFLDGASHPEDLVAHAATLGLPALAITDHDGLYGAVRFCAAARAMPTCVGCSARRSSVTRRGRRPPPSTCWLSTPAG
jgi:error-prone DNA polymerase